MQVRFYERDGVEFFHLIKESKADVVAAPFEFDGPATEQHRQEYRQFYTRFLKSKVQPVAIEMSQAAASTLIESKPDEETPIRKPLFARRRVKS